MSTLQPPCRVTVLSGGHGKYVADVTVYQILFKKGKDWDMVCSETEPTEEEISRLNNAKLRVIEDNPKIVLDSGKVLYGCECVWEPTPQEN